MSLQPLYHMRDEGLIGRHRPCFVFNTRRRSPYHPSSFISTKVNADMITTPLSSPSTPSPKKRCSTPLSTPTKASSAKFRSSHRLTPSKRLGTLRTTPKRPRESKLNTSGIVLSIILEIADRGLVCIEYTNYDSVSWEFFKETLNTVFLTSFSIRRCILNRYIYEYLEG
jgi:hypothetical protein